MLSCPDRQNICVPETEPSRNGNQAQATVTGGVDGRGAGVPF